MTQGNIGRRTMVKRSVHFHKHGKHKPFHVTEQMSRERDQLLRPKEPMFDTVAEAFRQMKRVKHR